MPGLKIANAAAGHEDAKAYEELRRLEAEGDRTPDRDHLAQVPPKALPLDSGSKLLAHAVRAGGAGSALARLLAPLYAHLYTLPRGRPRSAPGGLPHRRRPAQRQRPPRDLSDPLAAPCRTRALAELCALVNYIRATCSSPEMVLRHSVKDHLQPPVYYQAMSLGLESDFNLVTRNGRSLGSARAYDPGPTTLSPRHGPCLPDLPRWPARNH